MAGFVQDEEIVDDTRFVSGKSQLDVNRLPPDQVPRSRHDVQCRQPAGQRALETGIAHIERIDHTHSRLNGHAAIRRSNPADVTVCADQTRHDHFPRDIDALGALRNRDLLIGTDRQDLAVVDHEYAVRDLRPGNRDDPGVQEGLGSGPDRRGAHRHHEQNRQAAAARHATVMLPAGDERNAGRMHSVRSPVE